jgi:hypothetical protein
VQLKQEQHQHRIRKGMKRRHLVSLILSMDGCSTMKDIPPVEIIPDPSEPISFAGQHLFTGLSLTCCLMTAEMRHLNVYRLLYSSSLTHLSMPLPMIPILQSGPPYPGKQSLIKYFMLMPTPAMVHNEEVVMNSVANSLCYL